VDTKAWVAGFAAVAALSASAWLSSPEALLFSVKPGAPASPEPTASPSPSASPSASPSPVAFLDASLPATRATTDGKTEPVHVFVSNPRSESFKGKIRVILARPGRASGRFRRSLRDRLVEFGARRLIVIPGRPEEYPLSGWLFPLARRRQRGGSEARDQAIAGPPDTGDWPLLGMPRSGPPQLSWPRSRLRGCERFGVLLGGWGHRELLRQLELTLTVAGAMLTSALATRA
jgi:hypothetical protein